MAVPSNDALIGLWEQGRDRNPAQRGLLLLGAARPALDERARMAMSVAERDHALLAFRLLLFGPVLAAETACPHCGEKLEFELDLARVGDEPVPGEFAVTDGRRFRLPSSADLLAVSLPDTNDAGREIARRCCLDASDALDDAAIAEADSRMAAIHAAASIALRLDCVACGQGWLDRIDIASCLWNEIEERALDLLDQVHWLARHYGWSETAVLAMSDSRRTAYLDRCGL